MSSAATVAVAFGGGIIAAEAIHFAREALGVRLAFQRWRKRLRDRRTLDYSALRYPAIATEAHRAETVQLGSVHEGAGPKDIAQGPSQ